MKRLFPLIIFIMGCCIANAQDSLMLTPPNELYNNIPVKQTSKYKQIIENCKISESQGESFTPEQFGFSDLTNNSVVESAKKSKQSENEVSLFPITDTTGIGTVSLNSQYSSSEFQSAIDDGVRFTGDQIENERLIDDYEKGRLYKRIFFIVFALVVAIIAWIYLRKVGLVIGLLKVVRVTCLVALILGVIIIWSSNGGRYYRSINNDFKVALIGVGLVVVSILILIFANKAEDKLATSNKFKK